MTEATRPLTWSVGKFVYPRGGSTPLHFMPLDSYHLDSALDLSLLMSLRAGRIGAGKTLVGDLELSRWMDLLALGPLGDVVLALLGRAEAAGAPCVVIERFAGVGVLFELVKYSLARDGRAPRWRYEAHGPAAQRQKFDLLHQADNVPAIHVDETAPLPAPPANAGTIFVLNHNTALRLAAPPAFDLDVLAAYAGPKVLTARVNLGPASEWRTTVIGARVEIPSLAATLAKLQAIAPGWRHRFQKGLDAAFLLPEEASETGVLVAYNALSAHDGPDLAAGDLGVPRFAPA